MSVATLRNGRLMPYMHEVAVGASELSAEKACKLRATWARLGYVLPDGGLECGEIMALVKPVPPGVGTVLRGLLMKAGIVGKQGCGCANKVRKMNQWGADGCRENREQIVGWMRESYASLGLPTKFKACATAVVSGLAFQIDWTDPIPSLVDLAIATAEAA